MAAASRDHAPVASTTRGWKRTPWAAQALAVSRCISLVREYAVAAASAVCPAWARLSCRCGGHHGQIKCSRKAFEAWQIDICRASLGQAGVFQAFGGGGARVAPSPVACPPAPPKNKGDHGARCGADCVRRLRHKFPRARRTCPRSPSGTEDTTWTGSPCTRELVSQAANAISATTRSVISFVLGRRRAGLQPEKERPGLPPPPPKA